MQIVTSGDNLHEMSNGVVFWGVFFRKNIQFGICWIRPESGEGFVMANSQNIRYAQ